MNHFKNKTAIITGGASGIGRAICLELGRRGAIVYVTDINLDGAFQVADRINSAGGKALAARLDVTQKESVQQFIEETAKSAGRLDYMFNNAGIAIAGEARDMSDQDWRQIIDINLWGVIFGTTASYNIMVNQGFGHIVNTASLAGLVPVPTETAYSTTKFAVVGLSTSLRVEGEALGVKVSAVCPGFIKTGIFDAAKLLNADMNKLLEKNPFKLMDADQAARVILKGVEKNKAIIVVTLHGHVLWRIFKYFPRLANLIGQKTMKDFREVRNAYIDGTRPSIS
jgi:NAD(P)-dependent dehydrogenase (short-subunit alcohol dehydrogenase family)